MCNYFVIPFKRTRYTRGNLHENIDTIYLLYRDDPFDFSNVISDISKNLKIHGIVIINLNNLKIWK